MSLARWRNPIIDPWVPVGTRNERIFAPLAGRDYTEWPMSLDDFVTQASDWDVPEGGVECPCGAMLPGWDGSAGELLRMIYRHCDQAKHPKPRFDR